MRNFSSTFIQRMNYLSVKGSVSMIVSNEVASYALHQKIEKDPKEAILKPALSNAVALFGQSWFGWAVPGGPQVDAFVWQTAGNVIVDKVDSMISKDGFDWKDSAKMGALVSAINVAAVYPALKGVQLPGEVKAKARQ